MRMPDKILKTWRKIKPLLPLFSAIIMLLIASCNDFLSGGFYQILRILVCGVSGYFSFKLWKGKHYNWAWVLGIIAILFNPIAPIELDKDTWKQIDFFIALILGGFLFRKRNIIKYIIIVIIGIVGILLLGSIFRPGGGEDFQYRLKNQGFQALRFQSRRFQGRPFKSRF